MNYFRSERKQSLVRETLSNTPGIDFLGGEDNADSTATEWVHRPAARWMLRAASMISLVSVSANTPETFKKIKFLAYVTFVVDILVAFLFTAEMLTKIKIRGFIRRKGAYFRNRWCQFDAVMLFFIWASIGLQSFEIYMLLVCTPRNPTCGLWKQLGVLSVIRCPRPLILIRVFRAVLKFRLPKTRINAILARSSQQVYNVTLFLLFFMSLYGILGVQFFGDDLNYHCVMRGADLNNISLNDLAIPDTYCNPSNGSLSSCPPNMTCAQLPVDKRAQGAYIGFYSFHWSFFTVYQASSLEGWVFIMYRAMDSLASWKSVFYFVSMIFFLAWLVKNVFIAVLIETFAEIRVQFQQMWASPRSAADSDSSKIFQSDGQAWKLVAVDESKPRGLAPKVCQRIVKSTCFNVIVMLLVLANAISAAGLHFNHDTENRERIYYPFHYTEIVFTLLFDMEALFKIWCLGWRNYWQRNLHKCELILCIGTSLHVIPQLYRSQLTYFQVLRILRLIKASPMLEDFCFKIIGPGKKLGSLILFTMCLLIITSTVSLQLFCFVQEYDASFDRFSTFPTAFMSMFQILTQKGWVQVMRDTMDVVQHYEILVIGIAIYFTIYHCLVTLIVVSLFVAVILDNLELDEDIKKLKQLKMREISAETSQKLPMRLRIFEKFPNRPQMIKLARLLSDFLLPKIRDSFMRQFAAVDSSEEDDEMDESCTEKALPPHMREKVRGLRGDEKKFALNYLISESNKMRVITVDQNAFSTGTRSLLSTQHQIRMDRRSMRNRSGTGAGGGPQGSVKTKLRENGDVASLSRPGGIRADDFDIKVLQQKAQQAEIKRNQQEEDLRENHPYFDKPLFAVGRESRFRDLCRVMVDAHYTVAEREPGAASIKDDKSKFKTLQKLFGLVTYLDWIMLLVTTISCVSMLFETPYRRVMNTPSLQVAEYIFFVAMTIEMALKILANGFFFTPKAVIRDFGGVLDIFIYIISLVFVCYMIRVDHVPPGSQKQVLMILRCLRPLRIFILVPHIRRVVYEVVRGFREILMVSVLLVVFMFIFAVYGVHLFGGVLAICNDRTKTSRQDCVGIYERKVQVTKLKLRGPAPTVWVPRVWANPRNFNFDNIGNAMLALFEILSLEGWVEIRDVINTRVGPIHVIYIHLFVFIGCMIGLTLFVGVVIANYSESKGTALLTVDQRRWLDLKGRIKLTQPLHIPPRPNERPGRISDKIRSLMYDLTQNIMFKRASAFLVLINCALLYYPWTDDEASTKRTQVLGGFSAVFTLLFLVEVVLKILALTFAGYWQSRRNRYEMMVTMMGVGWIILHFALKNNRNISNNFGWFIVVMRFFTITGKHASLKMLMLTVIMSMLKSIFIIMGMGLLMFVYALAGVILFGTVKYGENLGRHANFHNTFRASALLIRIVTGEDWNKIMHDCMIQPPFCEFHGTFWTTNCGNFQAALIYFCSFYIIIAYIMLNLLVAIITENFSLFYSNEEDALLSYNDIRQFQNTWNFVDINRKGVIPVRRVKILLRLLRGRLEVDMDRDKLLFKHMCYELERIHNGNDVTFHDVLNMLSYRSVDIRKSLQLEELLAREELEYTIEEEVAKQTIRDWLDKCLKRIRTKESSNIVANLRATNEPLFTVTEVAGDPTIHLANEDGTTIPASTAAQRIRKISGTIPAVKKFLTPTLSGPDVAPRPDLKDRPMGFKRKRSLKGGTGNLPELLEAREDGNCLTGNNSFDHDNSGFGVCVDHISHEGAGFGAGAAGCGGIVGGQPTKKHSVTEVVHSGCEDVRDWWRSQLANAGDDSSGSGEEEDSDSAADED